MNTENSLVSIIVRTKDRPKLLKRALQSIAAQTYRPIEVVLVNDGGCDLDIEEIRNILNDVSLNYICLEKKTGRAHAGNIGMENVQGQYIGFLDDDDIFYKEHISVLVNLLQKYDYKVGYTDAHIAFLQFSPESKEIVTTDKRVFTSKDFSYSELLIDNYIPLMSILFSKDILKKFHGFDEKFEIYEDWDLLIRIAENCPFYHVEKVTAEYLQWSNTLQIAQASMFANEAREIHREIISKHKEKFTSDIIGGLVQNRRELREQKHKLTNLESIVQEREHKLTNLESLLQEQEGRLADLEGIKLSLERTLQEQEGRLADLEGIKLSLERTLQERETTLERIYNSRGWKVLLFYYTLRDGLLPHNSKRRAFVKAVMKAIANPLKLLKNLNAMNIRKFFHYLKNADPSVLEYKINKKLSTKPVSNSDSSVLPYDAGIVNVPLEPNSILLMGSFPSNSHDDSIYPGRIKSLMKSLRELNYNINLLNQSNNVEEYLKTYGGRFAFVLGIGAEYCYNYFPFVRAYAPNSKLIYHAMDLQDTIFTTELLNALISDSIIVDNEDRKQSLLQRNPALPIEVIPDTPDMQNNIERLLSNLREKERNREVRYEGEKLIEASWEEPVCGEEDREGTGENLGTKSVLAIGIYLANQENTVEHIIEQMNRSKRYHVVQKWIALRGDPPSENIKAVTFMKIDKALPKFQLLNKILSGEELDKYSYIVISDDDITLPNNFLDGFLFLQEKYNFALAQPARTHNSYIDHPFVEQFDGLKARRTRFVEIGPVFSIRKDVFPLLLPFDENSSMGWGYDFVWPCLVEDGELRMGIIDAMPVEHSIRKPMQNYNYEDVNKIMKDYLSKTRHLDKNEAFRILESYAS